VEKVIPVYKPRGKTSYQVVREFKKRFPGEKVGHAGTLDPLAEGLLIILVGKATKRQAEFMGLEKEYVVEAVFGINSPTWDLEGPLMLAKTIMKQFNNLTIENIRKVLNGFVGKFEQIVPAYSAIHLNGKRLYKEARKGRQFSDAELPKKIVEIKEIEILEWRHPEFISGSVFLKKKTPEYRTCWQAGVWNDITPEFLLQSGPKIKLRLVVGKGAYIRSIIYQLGKSLGVGAVMTKLVRTKVGNFHLGSGTFLSRGEEKLPLDENKLL